MGDAPEKIIIKNVSEELVEMYIDGCIKSSNACDCPRCRADIMAFALNKFPPHYVVTEFGDAITRAMALTAQFQADIVTAIMRGIMIVKEHPRH